MDDIRQADGLSEYRDIYIRLRSDYDARLRKDQALRCCRDPKIIEDQKKEC